MQGVAAAGRVWLQGPGLRAGCGCSGATTLGQGEPSASGLLHRSFPRLVRSVCMLVQLILLNS